MPGDLLPGSIRPAVEGDLDALAELETLCFGTAGSESERGSTPWSRGALAEELERSDTLFLVVDDERDRAAATGSTAGAIAYAIFRCLPADEQHPGEAELLRIAVAPGKRDRGTARGLLEVSWQHLEARGIESCHLEVHARNRVALRLYEGFGFVSIARRTAYYPDGGDALILRAPISSSPE